MSNPIESFMAKFGRFELEVSEDNYLWITAISGNKERKISIRIKADDDGAVVDMWPTEQEAEDAHASTWLEYSDHENG